jgi:histone H3/H4
MSTHKKNRRIRVGVGDTCLHNLARRAGIAKIASDARPILNKLAREHLRKTLGRALVYAHAKKHTTTTVEDVLTSLEYNRCVLIGARPPPPPPPPSSSVQVQPSPSKKD